MSNSQLVFLHSFSSDSVLFSLQTPVSPFFFFQLTIVSVTSESRANL